ncbi:probable ribosomal protein S11, mitochondrial [Ricinus communis]|uniref:Mitochondrial ribosomal protein S11, putative n=1 Tax=Ricinus communis TaxID=3988 RepID=B9RY19_RICCO|nr:probable ribosomal protein S11, mitochondrial [Ricinus communis]EEF43711.1 Mitochondrial ribosomal protein S11, putative [Ricinus communis]|eukprot:XP_002518786.1 probable ribosomal protein S11, mitochondrial [Ricinus communis]
MWSLSSLRKLSSSFLFRSYGGLSYIPSRYAAASSGGQESEAPKLGSLPNFGIKEALSTSNSLSSANFSAGQRDVEMGRSYKPMDFVRRTIEQDYFQFSRHNIEQNPDIVLINLKRNNTFINVLDSKGNTKFKATSGAKAVGGGGKVTRYAAEAAAEFVGRRAREMGLKSVVMRVKGFTYFKKKRQAIMSFREGFSNSRSDQNPIVYIEDVTQRPHNGCRLPKKRRI